MALSKFFKDHIYDSGEGKKTVPPPAAGAVVQPVLPPGVTANMGARMTVAGAVMPSYLDPAMVEDIQKVVARRTTAFTQLEQNAANLVDVIPDEAMRFKAAFKMVPGTAAQQVISSIDFHIRDVQAEVANFESTSQRVAQTKVQTLRNEVDQLNGANERDNAEIIRLQGEIQRLSNAIIERNQLVANKSAEANNAESEIKLKVEKFKAAGESVIASLKNKQSSLATVLS